jgi:hypothetical protein
MDAFMGFLTQLVYVAMVVAFFALICLAFAALSWAGYHRLHDHWSWAQLRNEARSRMLGQR